MLNLSHGFGFSQICHIFRRGEGGQKNSLHGSGLSNGSIARVQNSLFPGNLLNRGDVLGEFQSSDIAAVFIAYGKIADENVFVFKFDPKVFNVFLA